MSVQAMQTEAKRNPRTVEEAARAGLAGIAVVAGGSIVAEPAALAAAADKAKIFVVGIDRGQAKS